MQYTLLPLVFAKFWYIDAPLNLLGFFASLNGSFFRLFSTTLLVQTYFQPLKNEYRQGLVGFSIGMGMFVKGIIILTSLLIFVFLLAFEFLFTTLFVLLPVFPIVILFLRI